MFIILGVVGCTSTEHAQEKAALTSSSISGTDLGTNSAWVVEQLNQDGAISSDVWAKKVSNVLTAEIEVDELVKVLNESIRENGPFEIMGYSEQNSTAILELMNESGDVIFANITIDADKLISGIYFT